MALQTGGRIMFEVTVVIPNYNGIAFLESCMDSLKDQSFKDFYTYVIDNASSDGSAEYLKKNYPWAKVFEMETNLGFAGGVNAGIRMVKTPFVILLNNDTAVDKDYIKELLAAIKKSKRIFSASPKMIQMYKPSLMDDAGDLYTIMGWAAQRGVGRDANKYDKDLKIFSACGGAPIYRMSVLKKIGLFDENHFAYLEDIDLGYRAKLYGYKNVYASRAKVLHVGSGTSGSRYNPFKVKLAARNSVYVNIKNMAPWQIVLNGPFLIMGHLIKLMFFKKMGFGKDYKEGLIEGIKTAGKCKKAYMHADFGRQVAIEGDLIHSTLIYVKEFLARKLTDKKKK